MGNSVLIAEAGRGITKKKITELQETGWARQQGGICGVKELTEARAIYFAQRKQ